MSARLSAQENKAIGLAALPIALVTKSIAAGMPMVLAVVIFVFAPSQPAVVAIGGLTSLAFAGLTAMLWRKRDLVMTGRTVSALLVEAMVLGAVTAAAVAQGLAPDEAPNPIFGSWLTLGVCLLLVASGITTAVGVSIDGDPREIPRGRQWRVSLLAVTQAFVAGSAASLLLSRLVLLVGERLFPSLGWLFGRARVSDSVLGLSAELLAVALIANGFVFGVDSLLGARRVATVAAGEPAARQAGYRLAVVVLGHVVPILMIVGLYAAAWSNEDLMRSIGDTVAYAVMMSAAVLALGGIAAYEQVVGISRQGQAYL